MAERAKARVLVEILRNPRLDPAQAMTPDERAAAKRLAAAVATANRDLAAAHAATQPPAARLAELTAALDRARLARDTAEQEFFIAHAELRDRQPPRGQDFAPAALGALVADGNTTLLEYVVTDDQTILFTVTAGDTPGAPPVVAAHPLMLGRTALARRTQDFRRTLADRSMGWQKEAHDLGVTLLADAHTASVHAQRLIIVPDGPLWELTVQTLDAGSTPTCTLWEQCPVSFAPSLTFLAQSRAMDASRPSAHMPRLQACGDPSLGNWQAGAASSAGPVLINDESVPLPDAARQVRALGELYGAQNTRALVGGDAHEDEFKKVAGGYSVIHFATHGFLNDQVSMYSRLLMAQTDLAPDEDGLLEAREWLPLRLHARLAVLSACETGRGKVGAGEGVLGLSWALFIAGCPASVVSQWKVDRESTTELMLGFHRRLLAGAEPVSALREATLELARKPGYQHPFYWAPVVLVGAGERTATPAASIIR